MLHNADSPLVAIEPPCSHRGTISICNTASLIPIDQSDALLDKPSIAVLPFDNMSSDPEHEYFADGIAEDIITALSKIPRMRVIALGAWLHGDLAHMDADAHAGQIRRLRMRLLKAQREHHTRARRLKGQEASIPRPIDDPAGALARQTCYMRPMPRNQIAHRQISALRLQRGRIGEIREDESQDL